MFSEPIYTVHGIPVFQNKMFNSAEDSLACPTGDVELVQDLDTGLIFNSHFRDDQIQYDSDYQNDQSMSAVFGKYIADVMNIINRFFKGKTLIEVGCGKGYLVQILLQKGYDVVGIDPAYEGESRQIVKSKFEATLGIEADGLILRHVLEHVANPIAFLKQLCSANRNKGLIYIEVPCFDWIINNKAWYDIFYEHCNYFRRIDFVNMFGSIYDIGTLFGGQYLYVVADLASLRSYESNNHHKVSSLQEIQRGLDKLSKFAQGSKTKIAVWGAAAKGMIFCFEMMRRGISIDLVIDVNPRKQGKFLAGTGLKVMAPQDCMRLLSSEDKIFIMNSIYYDEILNITQRKFKYVKVDELAHP